MYEIFLAGQRLGKTKFEHGDPPMGVAFGSLKWDPSCSTPLGVLRANGASEEDGVLWLGDNPDLIVRSQEAQVFVGLSVGVMVHVVTAEAQVEVLAIQYPEYEQRFPQHVADYENRLRDDDA